MALIKCHECSSEISTEAESCPKCGARVRKEKKTNWLVVVPVMFVVIFILFAMVSGGDRNPEYAQKEHDKAAINLCWEEYGKKSREEGEKRFIAGACEMMEKKYFDKHGSKP